MSIEKHKAFIDSLDGEKGLPEKFYRMLIPGVDVWQEGDEFLMTHDQWMKNTWEKAFAFKVVMPEEIGRRAESRQIPDLKEKVKELVRDAMDATDRYWHKPRADDDREMEQIRALCAIEGKP